MAPSDQALLDQFASTRDGGCFAELVRRHSGMVYGVCRRVLRDGALAEDAAQETFLLLMRQPAAVSESVAGWLHRVAHRKAVDLVRREVGHARRVQPAAPVGEEEPTWATLSPLLDEALQELPEDLRRILVSHYLEARGQQELAEELGISQPTVSRRLAAGVAQLRSLLMAKGVVSAVLVASLLHGSLCAAAPATLTVELGKMTLAAQAGLGLGAAKAGTATATAAAKLKALWLGAAALALIAGGGIAAQAWSGRRAAPAAEADWRFIAPDLPALAAAPAPIPPGDVLGQDGPAHLLALTRLGGAGDDEVVGVAIAPDWSVLVAGNAAEPVPAGTPLATIGSPAAGGRSGFIARYAPDGRTLLGCTRVAGGATFTSLRSDAHGDLLVAGTSAEACDLGGGPGRGGFIAKLSAATCRPLWILYQDGIVDCAADAQGDLLVLRASRLTRYDSATGHARWSAGWPARGPDHPQALGLEPGSGIAVVAGASAGATGDETFLDPYARAFAPDGRPLWTLWDAEPARVRSGDGGLQLTAAGGARRIVAADGALLLAMSSSGGNTVLAHDAHDPARAPAPATFAGVHQDGPGFGFRGATPVSTLLLVEPGAGAIARQTWLSAWSDPAHAGAWAVADVAADAGRICAVGQSAAGGPARAAWTAGDGQAGGAIALCDARLRLLQAGTFPGARWSCTALRGGLLVVGGTVGAAAVLTHHAVQAAPGGGQDGYLAIFAIAAASPPTNPPAGTSP